MVDIGELIKRLQLQAVTDNAHEWDEAADIAAGLWEPTNQEIFPGAASGARVEAWGRVKRQTQTLGPRVMETKLGAILGTVTWGAADNDEVDEQLAELDIALLSRRLAQTYVIHGVASVMAHEDENGVPRISRLGGYLLPYLDPNDMDQTVGLFQAWQAVSTANRRADDAGAAGGMAFDDSAGRNRRQPLGQAQGGWTTRVYDFEMNTVSEWRGLKDPAMIGTPPSDVMDLDYNPHVITRTLSIDGLPLGEVERAVPQLKAHWASEVRLRLAAEMSAQPMLVTQGAVLADDFAVGPAQLISLPADGTAFWLEPGNLEQLHGVLRQDMERVREDLSLPGGFLGNDSPSGEAFREANTRFIQNASRYADELSTVMTNVVRDYSDIAGIADPPAVVIAPSKAVEETDRTNVVLSLFKEGVISLEAAVDAVAAFFPAWRAEDRREWLEDQTRLVRPEDIEVA